MPIKQIRLTQNYRSTPEILRCALPVISKNEGPARTLEAHREHGACVSLITADSDFFGTVFIAKTINHMVGGIDMLDAQLHSKQERTKHWSFSDIAILYRTHRQAEVLEKCLKRESIPYIVTGREDYLADEKVRACICFFRFLQNPKDVLSLRTCLKLMWKCPEDIIHSLIQSWEAQGMPELDMDWFQEFAKDFLEVGYLQKWIALVIKYLPNHLKAKPRSILEDWAGEHALEDCEPFRRLMNMAVFYKDMPSLIHNLILGQESDLMRSGGKSYASGTVSLMTLHGSKGLEFPAVFLCGVNQGTIPLESVNHPADVNEER